MLLLPVVQGNFRIIHLEDGDGDGDDGDGGDDGDDGDEDDDEEEEKIDGCEHFGKRIKMININCDLIRAPVQC